MKVYTHRAHDFTNKACTWFCSAHVILIDKSSRAAALMGWILEGINDNWTSPPNHLRALIMSCQHLYPERWQFSPTTKAQHNRWQGNVKMTAIKAIPVSLQGSSFYKWEESQYHREEMHRKSKLNASLVSFASLCKQKGNSLREENIKWIQQRQPRDTERQRSLGNEATNSVPSTSWGQIQGKTGTLLFMDTKPKSTPNLYT